MWDSSVSVANLLSVVTLVLTGQPITPVNVFMLIGFMDIARTAICHFLSTALLQIYDAYVSLARIEDFLLLENIPAISTDQGSSNTQKRSSKATVTNSQSDPEKKKEEVFNFHHIVQNQENHSALSVSNLSYRHIEKDDEFILHDIRFSTASQSLTVITGPVGSGKSTLLSVIAGEISDVTGIITFPGTLVYVPQTPWIFSGTIRKNILFGQPYDEPKYNRVIEACAFTVVGERGEVLSGGQKARVGLARAVYADAELYLLDDPLSAVDFKVGQHIQGPTGR